ncbi:MAG: DNA polymerase IV, partial [bacterium]|nr:DNA polymerase IV [bacterium]
MSRIVMHIDMNCYFASVEQQANPFLRGKPIGVTGKRTERSVVAAASIEAKRLGVKTAMSTWEAKRICPSIVLVHGDPEKYSHITHNFFSLFKEFTNKVEMFSVDEGFLDVTDEAEDYLGAVIMAQEIKHRLKEVCGERITASIGISQNKLMAKLASEFVKPDGLTVVKPNDVNDFLGFVELDDFCGIGKRIHHRLNLLNIFNVRELQACPPEKLV